MYTPYKKKLKAKKLYLVETQHNWMQLPSWCSDTAGCVASSALKEESVSPTWSYQPSDNKTQSRGTSANRSPPILIGVRLSRAFSSLLPEDRVKPLGYRRTVFRSKLRAFARKKKNSRNRRSLAVTSSRLLLAGGMLSQLHQARGAIKQCQRFT